MKHPLTEQDIRQLLKKDESLRSLNVPNGTIITPSALDFLNMNNISLNFTEEEKKAEGETTGNMPMTYIGPDGEQLDSKPEELTHLYGNRLTGKENPVIAFRGKLDRLCAMIMEAQILGEEKENRSYVNDLQEIVEFVRSLLPSEYKCIPLGEFNLLGFSTRDLRERSHHPEKYYGRTHIRMHYSMGPLCMRLNLIRTAVRETELAAVACLKETSSPNDNPDQIKKCREDIVKALNRLSGLFYILIYKYLPKNYTPSGSPGI